MRGNRLSVGSAQLSASSAQLNASSAQLNAGSAQLSASAAQLNAGSAQLTATGTRLVDRREIPVEELLTAEVTASLASPAWSANLTAAVRQGESFPEELGEIQIGNGIRPLFTGKVDRQVSSLSERGRLVEIEARSKGALLLDNEAVPCALNRPRLSTVFNLFVAPYGFLLYNPNPARSLGLYTVNKGKSEWEAFSAFVRRVYGCTPTVQGDQVVVDRPRTVDPLVIGGGGLPYLQLERELCPYHVLSKVVVQDPDGVYSSAVRNSSAAYLGVTRKRYIIPANEFADSPALDANQRIRRSMLRKEVVTAVLPGIVELAPGRAVRIADGNLPLENLLAEEIVWRQSERGLTTTLRLVRSEYY